MIRRRRQCIALYVPGIRDDLLHAQSILIQSWRLQGVRPVMFTMPLAGQEAFDAKLSRLISRIDAYQRKGYRIYLVGASAGASAVLQAYFQRKTTIEGVAYICGKINRPDTVSRQTYAENPAFKTSLLQLQGVLDNLDDADKHKIISFYSSADTTVPYADTIIEGVSERKLPAFRHGLAILYALSFGSSKLLSSLHG